MTDHEDGASVEQKNDDVIAVLNADGTVTAYMQATPGAISAVRGAGFEPATVDDPDKARKALGFMELTASHFEGQIINRRVAETKGFRVPKLSVPYNYYTRVKWSEEYYEEEPLVNALVNRDIDQAIRRVEFQVDEDKGKDIKPILELWNTTLNEEGLNQFGGLHEYNKQTGLELALSSLIVAIANWGPMEVEGKVARVPKVIQNLDPELIVPDIDTFTGKRIYYYKLTATQADELRRSRRRDNAWRQMIPDLGSRIKSTLPDNTRDRYQRDPYNVDPDWLGGPFLELPSDKIYVIPFKSRPKHRFPTPTLTSIFSALAMKRKLQLADWAVADGMINMIMVWSFPAGTEAAVAKSIVRTAASGGRVQSVSVPAQVKVEIVTPPSDILNSVDKFWIPVSEILAHFDFPLNSRSRGAGDLDSGSLDLSANIARLGSYRDAVEALDNYWLRQMALVNNWPVTPTVLMPKVDLTNNDAFRTFVLALFDRGRLSNETLLDAAGTTVEREVARRKREEDEGVEDALEIRPTFMQTTGTAQDGRPPDSEAKPRGGAKSNRPKTSAQSESRS